MANTYRVATEEIAKKIARLHEIGDLEKEKERLREEVKEFIGPSLLLSYNLKPIAKMEDMDNKYYDTAKLKKDFPIIAKRVFVSKKIKVLKLIPREEK